MTASVTSIKVPREGAEWLSGAGSLASIELGGVRGLCIPAGRERVANNTGLYAKVKLLDESQLLLPNLATCDTARLRWLIAPRSAHPRLNECETVLGLLEHRGECALHAVCARPVALEYRDLRIHG